MKLLLPSLIFVFAMVLGDTRGQGVIGGDGETFLNDTDSDLVDEDELQMHPAVVNGTNMRLYECVYCGGYTKANCRYRCRCAKYPCYTCEEYDCNCHSDCHYIR
ncbi:hypothetical protein Fcan01_20430 [Folsomia candida]|uniref:Uncharacterized protein n=1 Tax=Folsomia candida TaxID=158441 RepID=A0A226DJD6_FOLCA|nr:hypothetical protein Fcan01_20430 [Folsomia candida]